MNSKLYMSFLFVIVSAICFGQDNKKPLSPKETVNGKIGVATVEIVYCKPSARERQIMGGLVPYGEVWRTGANAATTIEFSEEVKIEGKKLPAGKYELFTIPGESEWTIIFQEYAKQWGAFSYKQENDVLRVTVPAAKTPAFVETFSITIGTGKVTLAWENTEVSFKVKG